MTIYQGENLPFFIMLLWLFCQNQAWATPQKIAVLELLMTPEDTTVKRIMEDDIRATIFQSTQPDEINILTRERTKRLLRENEKSFRCLNISCMNDLARSIDTEFVIFGSVELRDTRWTLDLRLFERKRNIIIATVENNTTDITTLLEHLDQDVHALIQNLPVQFQYKEEDPLQKESIPQLQIPKEAPNPNAQSTQRLRFHFLSFQCSKNKTGFNFLGYCHSGLFLGPVHLGGFVYSHVEGIFLGAM